MSDGNRVLSRIGNDMCRSILQYCSSRDIRACLMTCKTFNHVGQHKMTYKFAVFEIHGKEMLKSLAESALIRPYVQSIKGLKWSAKMNRCLRAFNHLRHLNLQDIPLDSKGAERLSRFLLNLRTLQVLNLSNTCLGYEGFNHIYRCLPDLPHLTDLNLSNCGISNIRPFAKLVLTSLDLSENSIDWESPGNLHFPMFPDSLLNLNISSRRHQTKNYPNVDCLLSSLPQNLNKLTFSALKFPSLDVTLPNSLSHVTFNQIDDRYWTGQNNIVISPNSVQTFGKLELVSELPISRHYYTHYGYNYTTIYAVPLAN